MSLQGEVLDLVPASAVLSLPGASPTALVLPPNLSFDQWESIGRALQSMERSVLWWIGDWLNYGERKFGERYAQGVRHTGYTDGALWNAAYVSRRVEPSRRREGISWSHHYEVAALPVHTQDELLGRAASEDLSKRELRALVHQVKNAPPTPVECSDTCTVEDLELLIAAGTKFGTIYADPPWLYGNQGTRAATSNHYDGMTIEQLCKLPIVQLAADNSHLHLWTTNAFLFDAKTVMEAWGYEYKSCFVWVKPQMGLGNYWRVSHEFLLCGIRGTAPFLDRGITSWINAPRTTHSAKPEEVRLLIERASPGPRLELFGRKVSDGWTVWGNQVSRTMFDVDVKEVA